MCPFKARADLKLPFIEAVFGDKSFSRSMTHHHRTKDKTMEEKRNEKKTTKQIALLCEHYFPFNSCSLNLKCMPHSTLVID
jgi:hypothetical protein